jgi:hypothetical protein
LPSWPLDDRATRAARLGRTEVVAFLAIAAGVVGLAYGGIGYGDALAAAPPGAFARPLEATATSLPFWLGVAAVGSGGALLLARRSHDRATSFVPSR